MTGHVLQAALYAGLQAEHWAHAGSPGTGREKQLWSKWGSKPLKCGGDLICQENRICVEFLSDEVFDSAHHHQNISSVAFRKAWLSSICSQ